MKREVLFKGIVIDDGSILEGEWFYGDLIQYVDGTVYIRQVETNSMLQVHPETVCQFTELFTGKKEKVYEGDWLENPKGERGYVVFMDGAYWIRTKKKGFDDLYIRIDSGFLKNKKIVGSIHDK